jgi:hypothetical protein
MQGFIGCQRWIGAVNRKLSVATYELDDADVLKSAAYNAIGNHARVGDNLSVWSKRVTARVKIPLRLRRGNPVKRAHCCERCARTSIGGDDHSSAP